jgi:hypothetical protein
MVAGRADGAFARSRVPGRVSQQTTYSEAVSFDDPCWLRFLSIARAEANYLARKE